jgi:uncharacterized protein (TIGR02145 family)
MKTNNRFWFYPLFVSGLVLIFTYSCKKERPLTLPELSTSTLTNITSTSVVSGGNITSDGGTIIFARGVCWGKDPNPSVSGKFTSDGAGAGRFSSSITGLTSGTNYYVRAYATNNVGTVYGNEFIFILPVTDMDGNVYNTEMIGTQVWMTWNLKTSRYNDSTVIPLITDNVAWGTLTTPAYCWYKNNGAYNKNTYGTLYNWFAVNTGKLCPVGWHVPSEDEWKTLTDYVGGENIASGELKESGTGHWMSPNLGASNDFGFTALPGGYRTGLSAGAFHALGYYGLWWASTEDAMDYARARLMTFDASEIAPGVGLKKDGLSVRCVKD